jgi:uncharacterized membrane protein (DUF485 family)
LFKEPIIIAHGATMGEEIASPHISAEYHAENQGHVLVAVAILFIVLDILFVALRSYAQRLNEASIGLDDMIIPFAWLSRIGLCILAIRETWVLTEFRSTTNFEQSWYRTRVLVDT